ncbi:MAG: hypothetical protein D3906_01900, partial [Candidatus Electrothrix sp. AUS1_2]|nr:hypothetical protein [Candidatus Electrothrix sp. AUS1_2]
SSSKKPEHPRDVIDEVLNNYVLTYTLMRDHFQRESTSKVILISYEQLFLQPHATLQCILRFLKLPVYPEVVNFCVEASSIQQTRAEEKTRGEAIHAKGMNLKGSFARSGKVGQWKAFFQNDEVNYIRRKLYENNIDYKEFWLES